MAISRILIPYNFSIHDWKAFEFIINAFTDVKNVKITLFNTYTPLPEVDLTANPELGKMRSGMIYLSEELRKKEAGLVSAKDHFLKNGFLDDQVDYVMKKKEKDVAEEIIDAVVDGHYDMVVLRPTPSKVSRLFARSVHEKILRTLKGVIVCIAT